MPTPKERAAFAQRLRLALAAHQASAKMIKGPTELARQFNLRHDVSISIQTAHKWLTGHTISTADKIKTLAEWLGVTEYWLRYGPPPEEEARDIKKPTSSEVARLAEEIQALPAHKQYLIAKIIAQLSKNLI